jgi:hypothetical protein
MSKNDLERQRYPCKIHNKTGDRKACGGYKCEANMLAHPVHNTGMSLENEVFLLVLTLSSLTNLRIQRALLQL